MPRRERLQARIRRKPEKKTARRRSLHCAIWFFADRRCLLPVAVRKAAVKRRVAAMAVRTAPVSGRAAVVRRAEFFLVAAARKRTRVGRIPAMAPGAAPCIRSTSASRACRIECGKRRPDNEGASESEADASIQHSDFLFVFPSNRWCTWQIPRSGTFNNAPSHSGFMILRDQFLGARPDAAACGHGIRAIPKRTKSGKRRIDSPASEWAMSSISKRGRVFIASQLSKQNDAASSLPPKSTRGLPRSKSVCNVRYRWLQARRSKRRHQPGHRPDVERHRRFRGVPQARIKSVRTRLSATPRGGPCQMGRRRRDFGRRRAIHPQGTVQRTRRRRGFPAYSPCSVR